LIITTHSPWMNDEVNKIRTRSNISQGIPKTYHKTFIN